MIIEVHRNYILVDGVEHDTGYLFIHDPNNLETI